MRNSLKNKRNTADFARATTDLATLQTLAQARYVDLFYYDTTRFTLISNVPRAWQQPDAPVALLATRGPGVNVAGFLRYDGAELVAFSTQESVKSVDVITFFEDFCRSRTQPTVVVLDNASTHRSAALTARLADWAEKGLQLFFLPPYSPELNRIEILWRLCKYQWLPFAAYTNFDALKNAVRQLLNKVGIECKINFA